MGKILDDFVATLDMRFPDDTSHTSMAEWVTTNTTLRKRPFSFRVPNGPNFAFQVQIINDMHPDLVCIKCSQIGLTESQLRKYLGWLRRHPGTTGIYTMPDDKMRDRVSQTRVKPIVDQPVFNPPSIDKPVRQKGLYQIETSYAYFTGSTEGDATSIPADIMFHDELDLTDQAMVGLFQSRLQASIYKIRQSFSTPTYPGFGVDLEYADSDQFEYFYRCPHCRHRQIPEFAPQFLCLETKIDLPTDLTELTSEQVNTIDFEKSLGWCCEKCRRPLDLNDPSHREWVARHPGRLKRGYRVLPTSVNTISVPYIFQQMMNYQRLNNMKGFHNTVLGAPYKDANAQLTEADIRACLQSGATPDVDTSLPYFLGIDVGAVCHLTLGSPGKIIMFRQIPRQELKEFVTQLYAKYNIIQGVMDRYPETTLSESIRDIEGHVGTIMPMGYTSTPNSAPLAEYKNELDEITHWIAHRTIALDAVASAVRGRRLLMYGYGSQQQTVINQLRGTIRMEPDEKPPVWEKLPNKDDHYFHSIAYFLLAQRLVGAVDYLSERDERVGMLLMGIGTSKIPDLSPRSLGTQGRSQLGMAS